jgi:hypothetical protein
VDVSQMGFQFFDGLAIQSDHQVQNTMGGRVLWANVDHQLSFSAAWHRLGIVFYYLCFCIHGVVIV